jgi:hypothetical protein
VQEGQPQSLERIGEQENMRTTYSSEPGFELIDVFEKVSGTAIGSREFVAGKRGSKTQH